MKNFPIIQRLNKRFYIIVFGLVLFIGLVIWRQFETIPKSAPILVEVKENLVNEPIQPIPQFIKLDEKKVNLGEKLFNEPQLSNSDNFSCASCHNLNKAGTDRLVHPININTVKMALNTPTIFNSSFNFKQHWDGNFTSLEDQSDRAITDPTIMGSNWTEIINKLKQSTDYSELFAQIYPDKITQDNIKNAIATFVRSLSTPNSRFDKFLRGDRLAITSDEKKGYDLFKAYGCVSCHQGVNIGGNMFQKFGIIGDYFSDRGNIKPEDLGRFNITKNEQDRYVFKVPSLRNIELTYPYFHDGSAPTLEVAVAVMAQYQLGQQLLAEDMNLIIKFLKTLNGEYKSKPFSPTPRTSATGID